MNFGFLNFSYVFSTFVYFALYDLYSLYSFLGLGHISLRLFFVGVCIVKVVIRLVTKYHLDL